MSCPHPPRIATERVDPTVPCITVDASATGGTTVWAAGRFRETSGATLYSDSCIHCALLTSMRRMQVGPWTAMCQRMHSD